MAAAIVQGAVVAGLTVFLVLGQISFLKPEVSRVMAAGGAGTWFTFGYVMYIIVGVIGVAVSALFYHYLENVLGKHIRRSAKALAWAHLVLMNVGTATATSLLMYAGYLGGASMLPENVGGQGFNAGQAHEILVSFVEPISVAILVIVASIVAGGIGFLATYRSSTISHSSELEAGPEVDIT
jgi:heme/copper-type cytochrome/quinol oxidase subunit 1